MRRFHQIIASADFEALFGPAQLRANNGRQNVIEEENEWRVAHKGVDKTHKCISTARFPHRQVLLMWDIDVLNCRSFAVAYRCVSHNVRDDGADIIDVC